MHLYENIKPLFKNKPLLIVLNKTDLVKMNELQKDKKTELEKWLNTNSFKYT
jgi:nucleolar GTP-binding protein